MQIRRIFERQFGVLWSNQHFDFSTGERNAFGAVAGKFIHDRKISLTRRLPHLTNTKFFKNDSVDGGDIFIIGISVSIPYLSASRLL